MGQSFKVAFQGQKQTGGNRDEINETLQTTGGNTVYLVIVKNKISLTFAMKFMLNVCGKEKEYPNQICHNIHRSYMYICLKGMYTIHSMENN